MSAAFIPPKVSELKALFAENGVRPKRSMGQNFMVDAAAMGFLAHAAALTRRDVVLEPGAGTGGLTALLAQAAGKVVAVELDRKLHSIASKVLAEHANVELIHADIMGRGHRLAPSVLTAVRNAMVCKHDRRLKVVANLPYSVSTAFITAMLSSEIMPEEMLVTVQREVADRICARPGTREYGYLSVLVRSVAHVRRLKRLSPRVFWPQPEVESCIIRITPDPRLRAKTGDPEQLRRVASALFRHRRKQAARALVMAKLAGSREQAVQVLKAVGLAEGVRPDQVTVGQYVRLARHLS